MRYIPMIIVLALIGCGGADCEDHDDQCKKIEGVRTSDDYKVTTGTTDVCNVYVANDWLGDRSKRVALFSSIAKLDCSVRGVFHVGFQAEERDLWLEDILLIFESHRASFWPTPSEISEATFLKTQFPYLEDKVKACGSYTVETTATWGTVVLDSREECDWSKQLETLQAAVSHGYERLDVVMENPRDLSTLPVNTTVFSGSQVGYSRDIIDDTTVASVGMAGPERGECHNTETTEACYPNTSFVVCTQKECKAIGMYSEVDSFQIAE